MTQQSRNAYCLHLVYSFTDGVARLMVWTLLILYFVEVANLAPLELILLGTMKEATVFLFEIPTGIVADVYSRRLSAIIGNILVGLAYCIHALFPVFGWLLFGDFVRGVGYTFISGAYEAWLVDELTQEHVGEALIRGNQVNKVGSILGVLFSIALGSLFSMQVPILIGGLLNIGLGIGLWIWMPETGFQPIIKSERATWKTYRNTFREGVQIVRQNPRIRIIIWITFFFGLHGESWDRLRHAHLIRNIGLPSWLPFGSVMLFGLMQLVEFVIAILFSEWMRRRLDMTDERQMIRVFFGFTALLIVGFVGFGIARNFGFAIGMYFLIAVLYALISPILKTWTNQHIPSDVRATVLSFQSQVDAIGETVGGPPQGFLGQLGLQFAYLGSAFILAPALGFLRRAFKFSSNLKQE